MELDAEKAREKAVAMKVQKIADLRHRRVDHINLASVSVLNNWDRSGENSMTTFFSVIFGQWKATQLAYMKRYVHKINAPFQHINADRMADISTISEKSAVDRV